MKKRCKIFSAVSKQMRSWSMRSAGSLLVNMETVQTVAHVWTFPVETFPVESATSPSFKCDNSLDSKEKAVRKVHQKIFQWKCLANRDIERLGDSMEDSEPFSRYLPFSPLNEHFFIEVSLGSRHRWRRSSSSKPPPVAGSRAVITGS